MSRTFSFKTLITGYKRFVLLANLVADEVRVKSEDALATGSSRPRLDIE
jgi:hypothetical protein